MEVRILHQDSVRFVIQARHHTVISDQPAENGGEDAGMTPPEFLLASLGSCAAYYAAQYLRTRNLTQPGLEVTVTAEKLLQPARLGDFHVEVHSPAALTEEQRQAMSRCVHQCLIHNTLLSSPNIELRIQAKQVQEETAHAR